MFKIRKRIFPDKGYIRCQREYEEFLEKNQILIPKTFFKMFHEDYFHDGIIKIKKLDFRNNEIQFDIDCPNFIDKNNNYVDVEFSCHFFRVSSFSLKKEPLAKDESHFAFQNSIFLCCEIGTMIDPHIAQSLVIKALSANDHVFYISLIFQKFKLYPKDPLLYKRMKSCKKIHL